MSPLKGPEFKWKTYSKSITLPPATTPEQKWAVFQLQRRIREAKEMSEKKMWSIVSGKPIYHHGDPV
jgi:hypothetical protein